MPARRTKFKERYFDYDGIQIRYVDEGSGDPILFLHGLGGKIEDNDLIFPFLTDRFRVISMDQPGSGWSDKPADIDYSVDYLVEFSFDFASRLGLDRFHVAGGSQGGLLTLLSCVHAPERVRRAVVYSPAGVWPPNPIINRLAAMAPPEAVRPFMHFTSLFWNSPTHPDYWKIRTESLDFIDNAEQPGFGKHVMGCVESMYARDQRELFAQITTPLLILWGRHDFGMPVSQGRELRKIIPHAEYEEIPEAGHNVFSERPRLCASKVIRFLNQGE